jgi:NhaP-type Na+/H+ or K+/H+ antiporter
MDFAKTIRIFDIAWGWGGNGIEGMSSAWVIACVGLMVFLAHAFVALFKKTRVPDVLLLISIGILLGPVSGFVQPAHFGAVGPVFAQVALAIILFEGGHDTQFEVLRENWKSCLLLTLPAFLASFALGTAFLRLVTGLEYESCLLFGAILGSTSPSVVVPLVKQLRMRKGPAIVLTMESAVADVLCLVLVLGFLEAHAVGQLQVHSLMFRILLSFGVAGIIGALAGLLWSVFLERIRGIQNNIFMTLALVFVLYGALDAFHLSGGVAALAFGMTVGNAGRFRLPSLRGLVLGKPVHFTSREKAFFSEAVFLIKTFFFLYLGISLHFTHTQVLLYAFGLITAVHLLRLPIVRLAMPRAFTRRDASLISALAPKGLAAAVLAALPSQQGWVGGEFIQELSYSIILFSIVGASVSVFLLESTPMGRLYRGLFGRFAEGAEARTAEGEEGYPVPRVLADPGGDAPPYSARAPS